jgi:hypothetical protein
MTGVYKDMTIPEYPREFGTVLDGDRLRARG